MKKSNISLTRTSARTLLVGVVSLCLIISLAVPPAAQADRFEQQIQELQQQNEQTQAQVETLELQAASYEEAIAELQREIAAIETQIRINQQKQLDILAEMRKLEVELAKQRTVLGENIKAMYVGGEMTTIEMLATSKDLSEFIDRETYQGAVQRKIQDTMEQIEKLQIELNEKKAEVDTLLSEQRTQRATLDANRAQQNRLLAMNQQQQDAYTSQMKTNNKKIADLREQQAIENARLFGGSGGIIGGGGYPWGNAACIHTGKVDGYCYNYDWAVGGSIWNWNTGGYGYRNCTDWVSWKVRATGGYVPSGLGNAKTWDDRAASYGFTANTTPARGAAAVSNAGTYGHVMYVESVLDSGAIIISDYNRAGTGKYNTATLERVGEGRYQNSSNGAISYLNFVHF